ncbi:MAG: hypothetical protein Q8R43_03345 [Alphaproteobacteria bacterium]|nr:hypothetical protein [Alphaproteobacteria bacterium]
MKRYMLGLLVLANFWINYISAIESDYAAVKISYTYTNDPVSRAAGLVPVRRQNSSDEVYTLTREVHFYGATRTVEEILDGVMDSFDLDDFVSLHVWRGSEKVAVTHTFTMEELRRIGTLNIRYIIEENTVECIKARRIKWIVDMIAGVHPHAWGDRAKRERIRGFVKENYVGASGRPRSLKEFQALVSN